MTIPQFIVAAAAAAVLIQNCYSGSSRNGYVENTPPARKELILYGVYKMFWSENESQWPSAGEYLQGYSGTSKVIFKAILLTAVPNSHSKCRVNICTLIYFQILFSVLSIQNTLNLKQ